MLIPNGKASCLPFGEGARPPRTFARISYEKKSLIRLAVQVRSSRAVGTEIGGALYDRQHHGAGRAFAKDAVDLEAAIVHLDQ